MLEIVEKMARIELGETDDAKKKLLEEFRQWVRTNKDLVNVRDDDAFLLRFLRVKKFDLHLAEQTLLKYLNLRRVMPHLAAKLDFGDRKLQEIVRGGYLFPSPVLHQGRRVVIGIAKNFSAKKFGSSEMARVHLMTYEALLCDPENQIMGFTHIGSFDGLSLNHVTMWSPKEFCRILKWAEQSLPMRHKEIFMVNVSFGVKWIIDVTRDFVSAKMRSRLKSYTSADSLKAFIEPAVLPIELGGTRFTVAQMVHIWLQQLADRREAIASLDQMQLLSDRQIIGRRSSKSTTATTKKRTPGRKIEID